MGTLALVGLGACAAAPPPGPLQLPQGQGLVREVRHPPLQPMAQDDSVATAFSVAHGDFRAEADRYEPMLRISFDVLSGGELGDRAGHFNVASYRAAALVPLVVDRDAVLLLGGKSETRRYDFNRMIGLENETVWGLGPHVGYGRFLNDDSYVQAVLSPGIYSDLGGSLKSEDWQLFGEGSLTLRCRHDLYLEVGVEVSRDFDDVPLFPLVGASWLAGRDWRVDVLLPRKAELSFLIDETTTVYLGAGLEGQEYRVRSSAAAGGRAYDMRVQELRVEVGAIQRFTDNLSGVVKFGAVVAGDHEFRTAGGTPVEERLEPTFLFEIGVGWDF